MITFSSKGDFKHTEKFLRHNISNDIRGVLNSAGARGVAALAGATPVDSGETAAEWSYEVKIGRGSSSIIWTNSHVVNGVAIAILLQYGHGTGTGGYVRGRDFINPAMRPIFDSIANDVWKAVTSA